MSGLKQKLIVGGLILVIVTCWVFIGVSVSVKIKGFSKAKAMTAVDADGYTYVGCGGTDEGTAQCIGEQECGGQTYACAKYDKYPCAVRCKINTGTSGGIGVDYVMTPTSQINQIITQSSLLDPSFQATPMEPVGQCGSLNGQMMPSLRAFVRSLYPADAAGESYFYLIAKNAYDMASQGNGTTLLDKIARYEGGDNPDKKEYIGDQKFVCAKGKAYGFLETAWYDENFNYGTWSATKYPSQYAYPPKKLAWTWSCCSDINGPRTGCDSCRLERKPITCGSIISGQDPCPGGEVVDGDLSNYPTSWACKSVDNSMAPWQKFSCGIDKTSACCGPRNGFKMILSLAGSTSTTTPNFNNYAECAPGCHKIVEPGVIGGEVETIANWRCVSDDPRETLVSKCRMN